MPTLLAPRRLAFRGIVEVAAWGFPRALVDDAALRPKVWALWQSGARLEEFAWGHVLHLPSPEPVRVQSAPALPFVRDGGRLLAAPLEAGEATELGAGVWVVEGGDWHALEDGRTVDVSSWLDVGAWEAPETAALGEVPLIPTAMAPLALDVRGELGIGAPEVKWQTIWERGEKGALLRDFAPGFWLHQWGRFFTPPQEVEGKIVASDGAIVLAAALVLGGALLFFLAMTLAPTAAPVSAGSVLAVVMALGVATALWRRAAPPESNPARKIPPLFVSDRVRWAALALVGLGVVLASVRNPDALNGAFLFLVIALHIGRRMNLLGRLVGRQNVPVPVSGAPAPPPSGTTGAKGEGRFARWLRERLSKRKAGTGPTKPKEHDDLMDAWRRLLARGAMQSGLFKRLGRAQARYLLRSMELFERGDLEAALRSAIALGGKSEGLWTPPPALGLPSARGELGLSFANLPTSGSLNFGPEIEAKLRGLYRNAFEKLKAAGDWQKAAFVLAELLQNVAEAVAFLEEAGQMELAARLAEGRELAPGIVVRAWWLAGNHERAVQIARLRGAFADAVTRLERDQKHRDDAQKLRLLWGQHLAGMGRFESAVEAVWPVPSARALALKWLRLGLAEEPSPRLVARALALEPGAWDEWETLLQALWRFDGEEGARGRAALARELVTHKTAEPVFAVAARGTVRALLRDGAGGRGGIEKVAWEALLALAGDGILRADVKWPAPVAALPAFPSDGSPLELTLRGSRGTLIARDAVALPNGELLVALGELGARWLTRDGRTKAHFDVPCHQIVRAFDAPRALLLARRDDSLRVSRLDLTNRKAVFWADVRADCVAPAYDGALWMVASQGRVRALDTAANAPASLWDCGDTGGHIRQLAIGRTSLAALVWRETADNDRNTGILGLPPAPPTFESWRFELPALVLRQRQTPKEFPPDMEPTWARFLSHGGLQIIAGVEVDAQGQSHLMWAPQRAPYSVERGAVALDGVHLSTKDGFALLLWRDAEGPVASLLFWQSMKITARLRFAGAARIAAREMDEGAWLLWDDLGRVAMWNATTGSVEREWVLT